jgi:hypothetical protein
MQDHENNRKVNAKAFVEDFVQGVSDKEVRDKDNLSSSQLTRLVGTLRQKNLVTPQTSALRRENLTKRFGTPDGPPDPEKDHKMAVNFDAGLLLKCPGCGAR